MSHFPLDTGCSNTIPDFSNPNSVEDSALGTTLFPNDSRNGSWPMLFPCEFDLGQNNCKRFLVFDRSGDKTTLIYSSRVQTLVQNRIYQRPNPLIWSNLCKDEPKSSICPDMLNETEDEMLEDTEELDALLCSDNDDDSLVDEEETSTGHSPSIMTDENVRDRAEEIGEEVDSIALGPTKRQKRLDGGYMSLLHDTESWCGNRIKTCKGELESLSCNIELRKEHVRQTLRLLRDAIPYDVSGKDAIVIIDEAIRYLKSLKVEVEAFGIDNV